MRHVYDKDFKYVQSGSTDLKETFKRVRERREKEEEAKAAKVCGEIKPKIRGKA